MKKLDYRKPNAEIVLFDNSDVITTSSECFAPPSTTKQCNHGSAFNDKKQDVVQAIWDVGKAWFGGGDDEDIW